jgi:septal ring factor EnvC (AmiA/AmiB activator)
MSTTADDLRLSLAIAAQEMAEVVEALRRAEEDRDSARRQLADAQRRIAVLSQKVRFVFRSRSHVDRLRAHLDQLASMLTEPTPDEIATLNFARAVVFDTPLLTATDHTGEIR